MSGNQIGKVTVPIKINNSSNQNHEHNRVNGHNNHNLRDSSHEVPKQPGPSEDQSKWPE